MSGNGFKAYQLFGTGQCARCGKYCSLTIDHFIPKSCRMPVNENGNFVGLCRECNQEKADKIVLPTWYKYIDEKRIKELNRYMRYAGSYIRSVTEDEEILAYLDKITKEFIESEKMSRK